MYRPDLWVIVKVSMKEGPRYRILGSWYGGYLGDDMWRLSSGIVSYEDNGDHYAFHNESGSIYTCYKTAIGLSGLAGSALHNLSERSREHGVELEVIDSDTFFDSFKGESDETQSPPSA